MTRVLQALDTDIWFPTSFCDGSARGWSGADASCGCIGSARRFGQDRQIPYHLSDYGISADRGGQGRARHVLQQRRYVLTRFFACLSWRDCGSTCGGGCQYDRDAVTGWHSPVCSCQGDCACLVVRLSRPAILFGGGGGRPALGGQPAEG